MPTLQDFLEIKLSMVLPTIQIIPQVSDRMCYSGGLLDTPINIFFRGSLSLCHVGTPICLGASAVKCITDVIVDANAFINLLLGGAALHLLGT